MSAVKITEAGAKATQILMAYTALEWCATETDGVVTRNWPRLSSGEELLWWVLVAVNDPDITPPADRDLDAGLDEKNAAYARAALRAWDWEAFA